MTSYSICLSLTYFTWHNALNIHLCCHKWQDFLLYGWIFRVCVCVCVCVYIFQILLIHSPLMDIPLFPCLGCYKQCCNEHEADIASTVMSFPSDVYRQLGFLDHMVVLVLIFWGHPYCVPAPAPVYIPTNSAQRLPSFHIFTNNCCFLCCWF